LSSSEETKDYYGKIFKSEHIIEREFANNVGKITVSWIDERGKGRRMGIYYRFQGIQKRERHVRMDKEQSFSKKRIMSISPALKKMRYKEPI
jgi:hypothetical protein